MPDQTYYGYKVRKPFTGEDSYFKKNPHVAGMAGEDGQVVLNPYSRNSSMQQQAVARNEAIRLWMRDNNIEPEFDVTPDQERAFVGTEYAKPENRLHLKRTLIARYLTGDSSAGSMSPQQKAWAEAFAKKLPR